VNDDALTRLKREQKAAITALDKVRRPLGNFLTRRRNRPRFMSLGRLVAITAAEARLAEIDEAIDRLQTH
jgi:hypothetical protein